MSDDPSSSRRRSSTNLRQQPSRYSPSIHRFSTNTTAPYHHCPFPAAMPKQRLTNLDIHALSSSLQSLLSYRLQNIYDINSRTFLLKFAVPDSKRNVIVESGYRIHVTSYSREKSAAPSHFVAKVSIPKSSPRHLFAPLRCALGFEGKGFMVVTEILENSTCHGDLTTLHGQNPSLLIQSLYRRKILLPHPRILLRWEVHAPIHSSEGELTVVSSSLTHNSKSYLYCEHFDLLSPPAPIPRDFKHTKQGKHTVRYRNTSIIPVTRDSSR